MKLLNRNSRSRGGLFIKLCFLVFGALCLTIGSAWVVRYAPEVVGNLCPRTSENPAGLCYEDLPAAGYPFSYWQDLGGLSVQGRLGPEDKLLVIPFITDWFLYFALISLSYTVARLPFEQPTNSNEE